MSKMASEGQNPPEDQTPLHCRLHLLDQMLHIALQNTSDSQDTTPGGQGSDFKPHLQVSNAELLLEDVGGVGAGSQAGHGGQVAAVASHRLHDEHAALGPRR